MNTTVRTTIRIRKDLFDQSRLLAFNQGTSLQQVVNDVLAKGFSYISDVGNRERAMAEIDKFRNSMRGKKINVQALIEDNKKQLEERTNRLLNNIKK